MRRPTTPDPVEQDRAASALQGRSARDLREALNAEDATDYDLALAEDRDYQLEMAGLGHFHGTCLCGGPMDRWGICLDCDEEI